MAHFAQINQENQVLQVIVVGNDDCKDQNGHESEDVGILFCKTLFGNETNWKQTSYNNNFRKNYAAIGYFYDSVRDAFIPPKPFESWSLNEDTCTWEAPIAIPAQKDDNFISYVWSEQEHNWKIYNHLD